MMFKGSLPFRDRRQDDDRGDEQTAAENGEYTIFDGVDIDTERKINHSE